jgi:hypothetical protein
MTTQLSPPERSRAEGLSLWARVWLAAQKTLALAILAGLHAALDHLALWMFGLEYTKGLAFLRFIFFFAFSGTYIFLAFEMLALFLPSSVEALVHSRLSRLLAGSTIVDRGAVAPQEVERGKSE